MADYAASASASALCVKLHFRRGCSKETGFACRRSNVRNNYCGRYGAIHLPGWKIHRARFSSMKESNSLWATTFNYCCLGSLVDFNETTPSEWIPVFDKVLLMASIFLTYMAGVIPMEKPSFNTAKPKIIFQEDAILESSTFSGSAAKNDDQVNPRCFWNVIKEKLLDTLDSTAQAHVPGDEVLEIEKVNKNSALSLTAIAEGPRLRLLWATLLHLEKEVHNIPGDCKTVSTNDWMVVYSTIIEMSFEPVFKAWLKKELLLGNGNYDGTFVSSVLQKFKGDNTILQNIRLSGKEDLYAELLCFLRFDSLREGCFYNRSLFMTEGVSILEDFLIALANAIASVYLELISVDSNFSNEMNNLSLALCPLSTRALQKLRNEVALKQWLHQNMEAVVSMFEDRFDLCVLQSELLEEPNRRTSEKFAWFGKLFMKRSGAIYVPLRHVVISHFSLTVKRTKELRALTGWRYYFSLFLELSDIILPLIRSLVSKVRDAISFFLVCLIGRSLGLVYTGIRQSLRWK